MKKLTKSIPLHESSLFGLKSKRKLAYLLGTNPEKLKELVDDKNYSVFTQETNGKLREIQEPKPRLKRIHSNLKKHLDQIETPHWLKSGKKGISYIDNAKEHQGSIYFVKLDIESFYPSCQIEYIQNSFLKIFQTSNAVAATIAKLVTFNGFVPTGSPASQIVAFWGFRSMFERSNAMGSAHELTMTLYVDDLTFSGKKPIDRAFPTSIKKIFKDYGHRIKIQKTRFYSSREYKSVTGVVISPSGKLKIPNGFRYKIWKALCGKSVEKLSSKERESIFGMLIAARAIEPGYYPQVFRKLKTLNSYV